MNPFDLPGPQFLLFYACFATAAVVVAMLVTRRAESGPVPQLDLSDPYRLAYLRGQKDEAIRVAVMVLVDRGLLTVDGRQLTTADATAAQRVRHPLERAIVEQYATSGEQTDLYESESVDRACRQYERELSERGLLPDRDATGARLRRFAWVVAVLLGVAAIKVMVAAARGRHNVWFLIGLAAIASVLAHRVTHPAVTARGRRLLADLKTLFAGLHERRATIATGGASADAALLAAVFGLAALPSSFVFVEPRKKQSASDFWGCGGGGSGCGGGCGGCGG